MNKRMNVPMPEHLKKWLDETADQMGLTTSAFLIMVVAQVKETTEKAVEHYHANK